ncbi:inositol-trisphosphate 3-kinase homolog isoform X2 [Liolophura sinensis]|uniref:inositol-trisphosphate 3-kinase homolog isoform X2 n=1 Tax=Liolophura sinensis TaxID=3198878 RepID=UPI003158C9A2
METFSPIVSFILNNALDLTAPASDALLKNRKNAWVQLAGHPGSFAPAGPDTIWKKRLTKDNSEVKAYQALMNDAAKDVVPAFYREVEFNGDFFIEMEDLLHNFHDPNIMDIKMGCRTFLEAEVKNPVMRKDLYEKMIRLDPDAPTPEEHDERAITKLRYMQFREQESSTASLGFRIEAIRVSGQTPITDLKKVKTKEEVGAVIERFINSSEGIRKSIEDKLLHLRQCFEKSEFFKSHELIGSSLLVMFDNRGTTGVWMIDFAKTLSVEHTVTHREPWVLGNHEDGYLTGLDNLIQVFTDLSSSCQNHNEHQLSILEQTTASDVT